MDRGAAIAARVAAAAFALVAAWEIAAPFEAGHWASMAACAIAAENMLRYHLFAAVTHYPLQPPPAHAEYYARHPYGIYVMEAVSRVLFGHRAWAIRVPAIVCSAATPFVLYRLGKALWGPVPAAVATVAFVVVPIDLAFAMFSSLEVPAIFFGLVLCLGTVRVWQGGGRRDVAVAALGALGACHSDWPGGLLVALIAIIGAARMARAYVGPRAWRGSRVTPVYRAWLLAVAGVGAATLVLYVALIVHAGQLHDLLAGAELRSSGRDLPWRVLSNQYRRMRLEWMVPPVGFAAIAAALPIAAWRCRRKPEEALLVAWVAVASFQYFYFRQGADLHVFWPHYYGPCVALSFGVVASALLSWKRFVRWPPRWRAAAFAIGIVAPIALIARVGFPMLDQSRATQGRYDEHGLVTESGAAQSLFAAWALRDTPDDATVRCTQLCGHDVEYASQRAQIDGPVDTSRRAPSDRDRIELVDARSTPSDVLREIAHRFDAVAVGPFLRVDRAAPGTGVVAMRFDEREPTAIERLFVTDHDLVRAIGPGTDPWATWLWADALDTNAQAPGSEPEGLDQIVVAYDVASRAGDRVRASDLRKRAAMLVDTTRAVEFTRDVTLLGTSVEYGPAIVATLLWETGPAFEPPRDTRFAVRCKTVEAPPIWPVPLDPFDKEMAPPAIVGPALWKPRRLYVQRFIPIPRPGIDVCRGSFAPSDPRSSDGARDVLLFTFR